MWRETARLRLRRLLIHLLVHHHFIFLISNVLGVLAPVSKTALPEALKLSEGLPETTLVSIEDTLMVTFLVDPAKSPKSPCLVIVNMRILLVLFLQLLYYSVYDVLVEGVDFYLRLLLHLLVRHSNWVEIWLISFLIT